MADIAVFGGSGMIGSRIVDEALHRGHTVTALARDRTRLPHEDERLRVADADVLDPSAVTAAARGRDVLVSAVGGGDGSGHRRLVEPSARTIVAALRDLREPPRFIMVGGAGSLETVPGKQVWDTPGLPEDVLETMHAHGDALEFLRGVTDLDWTNLSPPAVIEPGERTGGYRTDTDRLVADGRGNSRISAEDYAVALVDEIESPRHRNERFTVGD
ncbi:3-beta hydroxysteroid dehydrogenase [Streptomonospora alba]|uniref:3-beta hydroxysteroid dehydrogenase n=1 Tax=Streptomonospora alba TaxID=183763 RepID=A0A0C2JCQ1_9ACTN|nr:NAD(P)H-binding protein [Streptomonospora alba]KIH99196.1 3-beta hydroxysteroid dehydrogenase [Streptomonospora alba]